jgi:ketosteroid isomerase-like protein
VRPLTLRPIDSARRQFSAARLHYDPIHSSAARAPSLHASPKLARLDEALACTVSRRERGVAVSAPLSDEQVVRALFAAIDAGDEEATEALIAPDARFRFGSGPVLRDREQRSAGRARLREVISAIRHDLLFLADCDGAVVAEMEVTYTRRDGSQVTLPCANIFRLRDGLIVDYRIYMDVAPVFAGSPVQ